MVGGSKQKMKTGFGGKIHGASEVDKLVGEVERLNAIDKKLTSALSEARTRQNDIRGRINSLAEDDHSIKAGTLKAELAIAAKELNKVKGTASELQRKLSNLESGHVGKMEMIESAKNRLIEAEAA